MARPNNPELQAIWDEAYHEGMQVAVDTRQRELQEEHERGRIMGWGEGKRAFKGLWIKSDEKYNQMMNEVSALLHRIARNYFNMPRGGFTKEVLKQQWNDNYPDHAQWEFLDEVFGEWEPEEESPRATLRTLDWGFAQEFILAPEALMIHDDAPRR